MMANGNKGQGAYGSGQPRGSERKGREEPRRRSGVGKEKPEFASRWKKKRRLRGKHQMKKKRKTTTRGVKDRHSKRGRGTPRDAGNKESSRGVSAMYNWEKRWKKKRLGDRTVIDKNTLLTGG